MTEKNALVLLREDRPGGLEWFIDRYTAYVSAIAWNILGRAMTAQDVEEVTADVFAALWQNRAKARPGQVKGYLGQIARTRAINRLRQAEMDLELEEDVLVLPGADPETLAESRERDGAVRAAVQAMGEPDREIFVRHYYYCQTARQIAEYVDMPDREIFVRHYYYCQTARQIAEYVDMSPAAVRQRLKRGRDKLREALTEGGARDDRAVK